MTDAPCSAALLWTLPWVVRYLWFLPPSVAASPYFRRARAPCSLCSLDQHHLRCASDVLLADHQL